MTKLDDLIEEALGAEDRALMARTPEPGYFSAAMGIFRGPQGWVSWVVMLVQAAMFFVGLWCAFNFFAAADVLLALKWGLSAAVLMLAATVLKLSLMPVMQADRVIRQVKRLELMLLRERG